MKPFVGFSVGLSSILSKTGKIPFDIVNVDTHKGWQAQAFEYRAPKKGSYILSLSIGTYANVDVRVGLYVGQKFIAGMFEAGRYSDKIGEVTISKTIIAQAAENAPIFAALETAGAKLYSDYHYHTSLMGFLYVPAGITSIAWSVATTRTTMSTDPVSFETVLVNEGNGWKTDTKRFVAPEGGVYYIQLSTGRSSATWRYYSTINSAEVLVNGSPVMNVYAANIRESYYWYDSYSPLGQASRALVVRLRAGDELRVRVPNLPRVYDEAVYSNSYRLTSFSGFRIYA